MAEPSQPNHLSLTLCAAGCLALGLAGGWTLRGADRGQIESVVHDYILAHPEILPQAMDTLRDQQGRQALAGVRGPVETAWPRAVLGNPAGHVTLVEFTDYACGFCRASLPDVDALIAANPDLRVVVRELPILGPASLDAAKMALAAAVQGRYAAFRKAMYGAGNPDATAIAVAARAAGLDMAKAAKDSADPAMAAELNRNIKLARQLDFTGTPAWIVGDTILVGAVGRDDLAKAVAGARHTA